MNIFNKNLQALSRVDEKLSKILAQVKENEQFEVFLEENKELIDANILDHRDNNSIYVETPSKEINEKLEKFKEYDNHPLLYFIGLGNGFFYKKLLENEKHQSVMVIEPELEVIYIALNLVDLSKEIEDYRLIIKLSVLADGKYFIKELSDKTKYFVKSYNLHLYSGFYDKYRHEIKRVNDEIVNAFKFHIYSIGNSAEDSLIGLEHSLKNIPKMIETPTLVNLVQNAAVTKTAVIVSTGPSLAKQLPYLKKMQDYVTILCIDASFPILAKEGIKPDIVLSIERVPLTGEFYKNTPKEFHKDVIFSLATVCHDNTVDNIHGDKCFYMRADSYNRFFGFSDWGYLGGGMSSANFIYDLAVYSGFENIIFIGQDLSYAKDGSSHSKNHVFGEDEVKANNVIGYVEAYGGNGEVPTTQVWKAFLNSFKMQVSYAEATSINSTEGGARIEGTIELPFKEACEKYLDTSRKKEPIALQKQSQEIIEENMKIFKKKKEEAVEIGDKMARNAEKLYKKAEALLKKEDAAMEALDEIVEDITLIKADYNDEAFSSMYSTLLLAYISNLEFKVAEVYVMRENTPEATRAKKIEWIKIHQEWFFRLVTNIDAIIKLIKESQA